MITRVRRPTSVRRLEIIEAARLLITERGIQSLTIGNLARAVGVSEGAIYRHFSGKKRIIAGVIEDIDYKLARRMDLIDGDPDAGLARLEQALRTHAAPSTTTGVSFLVISEVLMNGDEELRKLMQAAINRHLETIEAHLKIGALKGEVRADVDVKAAAVHFYGLIQAVNTLNHFGDEKVPSGDSRALWQVFTRGVSER